MLLRRPASHGHGLSRAGALLAVCLAVCLTGAGCRPAADSLEESVAMDWSLKPSPPTAGPVRFVIELTDRSTGRPLPGATLGINGDMTHPGMQPVFATAREVAPGRYEAELELTMAGDWVISVDARLQDGRRFERQVALAGVRPRPGAP